MCQIYLHNYVVSKSLGWSPNPYVGDLNLRTFVSWLQDGERGFDELQKYKMEESSIDL
jgi:hypothetical protein